jgi:hypothetical protein
MKKIVFLIIFIALNKSAFSLSYSPDFVADRLVFNITFDYGKTIDNEIRIININLLFSPFPSRPATFDYGLFCTFSPDKTIFDLYTFGGITFYPFRKIFSLSCGFGIGISMYALLNHFPYLMNIRANFDIPIYKMNHITFGAGVQHRNSIKLIGYIGSDNYHGIYNSYFLELGYRLIIN